MADLLSWLGKRAKGAFAEINPFDNGENYQSVVHGRPPQPPAQRPQAQPNQPQGSQAPQQRQIPQRPAFNTGIDAITASKVEVPKLNAPPPAKPPTPPPPKPQQPQLPAAMQAPFLKTQQEMAKRNVEQPQQKPVTVEDAGKFLFGGTAKLANQGLGVVEKAGVNLAGETQKFFGDKEGGEKTIREGERSITERLLQPGKGLFGAGGIYNSVEDLHDASAPEVLRKAGGTGLQSLAEIVPIGRGFKLIPKAAPIVEKAAEGALQGAISGGTGAVGAQMVKGEESIEEILKSTAQGAVFGAGLPLAATAGGKIFNKAIPQAPNVPPRVYVPSTQVDARPPAAAATHTITPTSLSQNNPKQPVMISPDTPSTPAYRPQTTENPGNIPTASAPQVPSRFARRVPTVDELSPELRGTVRERGPISYSRVTNDMQLANSEEFLKRGMSRAYTNVNERLSGKNVDDQTVSDTIALIKRFDEKGGDNNLQMATDLVDKLSEQLTKSGQAIQAASLLSNRTPQGLYYGAVRSLKKAGIEVDAKVQSELKQLIDTVKTVDPASDEGAFARYNIAKYVNDKTPTHLIEKGINVWRAGLLTAPTTTGGNILGNTGETLTRKLFVNPVATAADTMMSAVTGKRTQTLNGGFLRGAEEGAGKLKRFLKTGYDERNALSKFDTREINYGDGPIGEALTRYSNGVYRLMSVADQPYWYGARSEALRSIAKAEALNQKISLRQRPQFINDFVTNPSPKALERATHEAMYATFQNKTGLGTAALGFKHGINKIVPGLGDFIVPFTQVPAAIATRIFQRTPVGTAAELVKQIMTVRKGGKFDQRAMAQAIGEGAFGTAVLASGFALANSGLLTFGYPKDQKERELWESEGKQPYSLKVGDRWYSLNYIQPFGTLLAIGGQAAKDVAGGSDVAASAANAMATAGQSIMNQSFLKGVSGVLDAIDDPARYGSNWIENTSSSVVPNAVRSLARASDPVQRDINGPAESFQSAIPGLRQGLPEKQDMFGEPMPAKDNFVNQFVNPLRPSIARDDDAVIKELRRLYDGDEGILPTQAKKDAFEGTTLTDEQLKEINATAGPKIKEEYAKVLGNAEYTDLSDEDKRGVLKKINDTVYGSLKDAYGFEKGYVAEDKVKLNTNQKRFLNGKTVDFLSKNEDKTFQEKYDDAAKEFEEDSKDWSPVERTKKQNELERLKIQKDFSNDTVDLYSMSKGDVYSLVSGEQGGDKMVEEILAYGDAMVAAGVYKTNKFRDKYGNVKLDDDSKKSGGSKRRGGKRKAADGSVSAMVQPKTGVPKVASAPSFGKKGAVRPAMMRQTQLKRYSSRIPRTPNVKVSQGIKSS